MNHRVEPGESLSIIARRLLGDADRWPEIARLNGLTHPDTLLVGQTLRIPPGPFAPTLLHGAPASRAQRLPQGHGGTQTSLAPGRFYLFVLADEVTPRGKVVRRVIVNPRMAADVASRIGKPVAVFPNPERWGFTPSGPPNAPTSIARHVANNQKPSPFLSASRNWPFGASRFAGRPFYIDEAKARAAGATFHEQGEIIADLQRVLAKTRKPADRANILQKMAWTRADREVLLRGPVPATAVKGPLAMGLTHGLRVVQVGGVLITAYDMKLAADKSQRTHSVRPLAAETVRQAGGWAAAWAGMKLGALGGAAVGIETGPGAVLTGAAGGVIGGIAGYYGFDWIADHIDEN